MAAKDAARGKSLERAVGARFGWRRRRNGEGVGFDDCVDEHGFETPISIEAKAYSVLQLRGSWIAQAIRNATGRPWMVVQRPKGSRRIYATVDLETLFDPGFLTVLCEAAGFTNQTEEEHDVSGRAAS